MTSSVPHGGNLSSAVQTFGGHRHEWLDLSTGINPTPYEFEVPGPEAWARLPEESAFVDLREAAAGAYGVSANATVVVAGGTQAIIQSLPFCRPAGDVAVLGFTYAEHALAWRRAGHQVTVVTDLREALEADVVVVTNPNNPDGRSHTTDDLARAADALHERGGLLVIDEAFADVQPEHSMAGRTNMDGIVVTRSFGKFFGLAGVRIGFAITNQVLGPKLQNQLGPWPAAGPSIAVATTALRDLDWQQNQRRQLTGHHAALCTVLQQAGLSVLGGTDLFTLVEHRNARALWQHLAQHHILTRRFDEQPTWLRLGLASDTAALSRLAKALSAYLEKAA